MFVVEMPDWCNCTWCGTLRSPRGFALPLLKLGINEEPGPIEAPPPRKSAPKPSPKPSQAPCGVSHMPRQGPGTYANSIVPYIVARSDFHFVAMGWACALVPIVC